ncbi:MAG: TonB-dependent receptor [Ignavibacteriales bacterium]|nr:TonB-dependent receptor [Ignavibacteriales bacterium]
MIKKTIYLIFILTGIVSSQEKGTIRGIVRDSTTLEALAFGNVLIKEEAIGASTNNKGYFVIRSLPANKKYSVIVSYIGYLTKQLSVIVENNKVTDLEILLSPTSIQFQAIEKIEYMIKEKNVPDLGKTIITLKDLAALPHSVEADLLRSLFSLPGVQSTGDVSAKFNVRGGETNQNLILLDGIPIYYPFHAIGLFSVMDLDLINNVEFFKGGFPAKYGGALSSVVNIITQDGDKNKYAAKLSASFLSLKGVLEGPLPYGSFYLSGRKSTSKNILKKFVNNNDLPVDFFDLSAKANFANPNFLNGSKITLMGLWSKDNLKYEDVKTPDYKWANNNWGMRMFSVGENPLFLDFGISVSNYKNEIIPKESDIRPKSNEVTNFTVSTDFLYVFESKDEINIGAEVKSLSTKLFLLNNFDYKVDVGDAGIAMEAYLSYKFLRLSNFGADIGMRFNLSRDLPAEGDLAEPRVSINYLLTPEISLKGAFGIYQQDLTTIVDEREVLSLFDPVIVIPGYLRKSKAVHYIFGISSNLSSYFSVDLETYYKKIISSPTLNEKKVTFSDPDFLASSGESYGQEVQMKSHLSPFDLSISYTLSWAFKEVEGIRYVPRYDSRHNLNISLTLNLADDWQISANWAYNSGYPFTQQSGYYDKLSLNNFLNDYRIYNSIFPVTYFANKNAARLPDYHRLDLVLSKNLNLNFMRLHLDVSAINVYNRANIYYFEQTTGKRVNMLPFLLTATMKIEI